MNVGDRVWTWWEGRGWRPAKVAGRTPKRVRLEMTDGQWPGRSTALEKNLRPRTDSVPPKHGLYRGMSFSKAELRALWTGVGQLLDGFEGARDEMDGNDLKLERQLHAIEDRFAKHFKEER